MMMLGDILAEARRSSGTVVRWIADNDPDRAASIETAAARLGETVPSFVRGAVADFSQFGSEDDWADLTSRLRATDDPGRVCLFTMLDWRLVRESDGTGAF
ncbi:hypothetical protein [Consotaella aegiceratis]|uniref:hypothetical protein n=1 Tax=Consotaella aegiceratis TaxID=3097961 RepID=UPI002F3EC0CC